MAGVVAATRAAGRAEEIVKRGDKFDKFDKFCGWPWWRVWCFGDGRCLFPASLGEGGRIMCC